MYENDVIQVTQSYDLTYIFWDVKTEQQNQDINYRDKLIVNRIDTSKEKKYQAAAINFFDSYYNEISQTKIQNYIYRNQIFQKISISFILFLKIDLQEYMIQDKYQISIIMEQTYQENIRIKSQQIQHFCIYMRLNQLLEIKLEMWRYIIISKKSDIEIISLSQNWFQYYFYFLKYQQDYCC